MERQGGGAIAAISIATLVLLVALPILFVVLQAVFPHLSEGSLRNPFQAFGGALGDRRIAEMVFSTLALGVGVCIGCVILAAPLAYLRAMTNVPGGQLWDLLFLIPFMVPPYVGALGWIFALQPGGFTTQLFGFNLGPYLFSLGGVVAVMTLHTFPAVYFALSRTLAVVGGRYADVARVCGARPLYAFWRVTAPLSLPGLAASLLLVFALTIEEYGTPATLGRQSQLLVLVTGVEERLVDYPIDLPGAAVISLVLMALALAAFFVQRWIVVRRSYVTVGGKHNAADRLDLGWRRWPAAALFLLVVLLAVAAPVGAVTLTALSRTLSGGLTADNLGLQHFVSVLNNRAGAMDALFNSLWLAAVTALVAGAVGALAAYITVRLNMKGRGVIDGLATLPNALPGIVLAVGLILAWNRSWWPVQVYNTPIVLLLAYVCLLLPYPVRYVGAGLRQIGPTLDAAARVSGAGTGLMLWRILAPLIAPHLLIAMLVVFAIATRELVASVMLAPSGMKTVATFVFNQFAQGSPGVGIALSVLAIFTTSALLVVVTRLSRVNAE